MNPAPPVGVVAGSSTAGKSLVGVSGTTRASITVSFSVSPTWCAGLPSPVTSRSAPGRDVVVDQIDSRLHKRQRQVSTISRRTLPTAPSKLATQLLNAPYNVDSLRVGTDAHERDLERGLRAHLCTVPLEPGVGIASVGRQYHLAVGGEDI